MTKLRPPATAAVADPLVERMRRDHEERIRELQKLPSTGLIVVAGIELADGVETPVAHGLGRNPVFVRESCPRGATSTGRVIEVRSGSVDRSKTLLLKATGFTVTITVDVLVL